MQILSMQNFDFLMPFIALMILGFAKVLFGGGVSEMRGKIGGTIFSRNKGGPYAKNMANPTNPQSTKQLLVRSIFSAITTLWQNLTSAQRTAWSAAAEVIPFINSIGLAYYLTGKGLFQKCNTVLQNVGITALSDAPTKFEVPDAPSNISIAAAAGAGTFVLSADDGVVPADRTCVIDGAPQGTSAMINNNSLFKRLTYVAAAGVLDTLDLTSVYTSIYGAYLVGQKLEIRVAYINNLNGMMSSYIKADTIVLA